MAPKTSRSRISATERVEQHIRQCIYSGMLTPRERLIEEDLAKQLKSTVPWTGAGSASTA